MQVEVSWQGDLAFKSTTESGQTISLNGDKTQGPTPMEAVLAATASCSSVDVVSILQKARQQVSHVDVKVSAVRADGVPAVFTDIHLHFVVSGDNINPTHVERAVDLSADKYCSVSIMLGKSVNVTHSFEVKQH